MFGPSPKVGAEPYFTLGQGLGFKAFHHALLGCEFWCLWLGYISKIDSVSGFN